MSSRDHRQIPLPEPAERSYADEPNASRRLLRNFAALVVVGAFAGIVWYAYHLGASSGSDGVVPVIKAEAGPIKEKVDKAGEGGIDIPNLDKSIYDVLEPDGARRADRAPPRKSAEIGADGETLDDKVTTDGKTKPPAEEKKAATADLNGRLRIQLAALSSDEDAARQWKALSEKHKDLLGGLGLMVEKVEVPARKQTLYRLQAGPIQSEKEAQELCAKLVARKVSCFLVKP